MRFALLAVDPFSHLISTGIGTKGRISMCAWFGMTAQA
jgi:hypothetical protein